MRGSQNKIHQDKQNSKSTLCPSNNTVFVVQLFPLKLFLYLRPFSQTLLPKLIDAVDNIINRQLSFGYDVGKGYIIAEEEIIKLIDHMVVDKRIAKDLKQRSERSRLDVVKSLGKCDKLYLIAVFKREATF